MDSFNGTEAMTDRVDADVGKEMVISGSDVWYISDANSEEDS